MTITAALVKELRERTGSGMMECKKALSETQGDLDAAVELMRKAGLAKADKKSARTAAEGTICIRVADDAKCAAIVEVNCETDFVGKGDEFLNFCDAVAQTLLQSDVTTLDALLELPLVGMAATVEQVRRELVAKIGENIAVRRIARFHTGEGHIAQYRHGSRIGVLVELSGDAALGKDVAMHIAASKPVCVDESGVPADVVGKEREIFAAQAAASGKPANIVEKMVDGRIKKFLGEITLLGQPFVKDPDQTVAQLLKAKDARVTRFVRFEVGEGIEKAESNFAEEVMAQVRGT
jgi:elongation factor Ts